MKSYKVMVTALLILGVVTQALLAGHENNQKGHRRSTSLSIQSNKRLSHQRSKSHTPQTSTIVLEVPQTPLGGSILCNMCTNVFNKKFSVISIQPCGHVFHKKCIHLKTIKQHIKKFKDSATIPCPSCPSIITGIEECKIDTSQNRQKILDKNSKYGNDSEFTFINIDDTCDITTSQGCQACACLRALCKSSWGCVKKFFRFICPCCKKQDGLFPNNFEMYDMNEREKF